MDNENRIKELEDCLHTQLIKYDALQNAADGLLAIMLANVDHAMSATHEAPAVFNVGPVELGVWAEAVEAYENIRHPIA